MPAAGAQDPRQTNTVFAERDQPALRDGVTAHALRASIPRPCATANEANTARPSTTSSTGTAAAAAPQPVSGRAAPG